MVVDPAGTTPFSYILVDAATSTRTIIHTPPAGGDLRPEAVAQAGARQPTGSLPSTETTVGGNSGQQRRISNVLHEAGPGKMRNCEHLVFLSDVWFIPKLVGLFRKT